MIGFSVTPERIPGSQIVIHCPACQAADARARVFQLRERAVLFWVIPLFDVDHTMLTCMECDRELIARCKPEELNGRTPDELSGWIRVKTPVIANALTILAMLFVCSPPIGIGLGIAAVIANRRRGGWLSRVSWFFLIASCVNATFLLIATWKPD